MIRVCHTGADRVDGYQQRPGLCLGGMISSTEARSLSFDRNGGLRNVRLNNAVCGTGRAVIRTPGVDSVAWISPGESTVSDAVTVGVGETVVVPWGDGSQWISVTRPLDEAYVAGREESFWIWPTYNTACAGPNFVSEAASGATYTGLGLRNDGDVDVTGLTVTPTSAFLDVGQETVVAGAIQAIADAETAPVGITWTWPGGGVTIPAGGTLGLWIRRNFGASVSAQIEAGLTIVYSCDGVDGLRADISGLTRRGMMSIEQYEVFTGVDGAPDYESAPAAVGASLPVNVAVDPDTRYYVETLFRNRFGLVSMPHAGEEEMIITDGVGDGDTNPPQGPVRVQVLPKRDGKLLVVAQYMPTREGVTTDLILERQASEWLVYERHDGTDPDPGADTPYVEAMATNGFGARLLEYEVGPFAEGTPVKVIVRTRRGSNESENTDVTSGEAVWYVGQTRRPSALG